MQASLPKGLGGPPSSCQGLRLPFCDEPVFFVKLNLLNPNQCYETTTRNESRTVGTSWTQRVVRISPNLKPQI